jgi:hypothetical protein
LIADTIHSLNFIQAEIVLEIPDKKRRTLCSPGIQVLREKGKQLGEPGGSV